MACAQDYPTKPIRLIVPSAAGGAPDINARLLASELVKQMGRQIVVDNRPGAAGSIGMELVVRAVPDGYTIGYGTVPALAINRSMYPKLSHDPEKDLQKVAQLGYQPNLLAVAFALPVKSVKELIAYAKSSPGKLSYGSSGNGTTLHLGMEQFKLMTGTQMVHVPYKGAPQATTEMIAGQVHLMFDNFNSIFPHVKAGRVRGLGVTTLKRSPALPDLPTLDEAGVPGFELTVWGGIVVPVGVPKPIVAKLNAEINRALATPELKEKFSAIGYTLVGGTPEQFDVFVKKEVAKWADVIKRSGAKVD
ncbi:MAG: Bug family tripartite tricarboxylate transporter substrate binding protein [Burkholderiales bacterium]